MTTPAEDLQAEMQRCTELANTLTGIDRVEILSSVERGAIALREDDAGAITNALYELRQYGATG